MSKNTKMNVHALFNIILSVLLIAAGICLMAGCLYIYYGRGEYSAEIIAEVFGYIAIPVYVCLVMIVGGFVFEFISPLKRKKEKPERDYYHQLLKLRAKKDLSVCDKEIGSAVKKESSQRRLFSALRCAVTAICATVFLCFALIPSNYHQSEINESMIFMMTVLAPCLFVSGAFSVFVAVFGKKSMEKEIELLKKIPDKKGGEVNDRKGSAALDRILLAVKIAVVLLGVAALVYGAVKGGFSDVMTKAVNICTECIGLG